MLTLSVSGPHLPLPRVHDYADSILAQKISQVSGVGLVTLNGSQKPAVRVQVDPAALAGAAFRWKTSAASSCRPTSTSPKGNLDGRGRITRWPPTIS